MSKIKKADQCKYRWVHKHTKTPPTQPPPPAACKIRFTSHYKYSRLSTHLWFWNHMFDTDLHPCQASTLSKWIAVQRQSFVLFSWSIDWLNFILGPSDFSHLETTGALNLHLFRNRFVISTCSLGHYNISFYVKTAGIRT